MKLKRCLLNIVVLLSISSAVFAVENCGKRDEVGDGCGSISDKSICEDSYQTYQRHHYMCSWAYGNKCVKTTRE